MKKKEILALTVGPDDVLFISYRDPDMTRETIQAISKSILGTRPDLKGRLFIFSSFEGVDMAVVKKSEAPDCGAANIC